MGGEVDLAGVGLGGFHEALDVLDAGVAVDGEAQPHDGDLRHGAEVLQGVAGVLDLRGGGEGGDGRKAEGVTVRAGLGYFRKPDDASRTGLVHDV